MSKLFKIALVLLVLAVVAYLVYRAYSKKNTAAKALPSGASTPGKIVPLSSRPDAGNTNFDPTTSQTGSRT